MNRREFLLATAAFGALSAARGAQGRPLKVSPIRGGGADEVLKITPIEIRVGAGAPFKALHFSDTHLNFWDVQDFFGNPQKEEHFGQRWVRFPQALNSLYATIDYAESRKMMLLHTGDLIDWNTRANRNVVERNLKGRDFFYALGNHEYHSSAGKAPEMSHAEARGAMQRVVGNDLTVASRVVNGVNIVAFDNGEMRLREETVARVKAEFAKGLPVVLMCHIPPTYTERFLENGLAMKRQILRGQGVPEEELAKLKRSGPIEPHYDERTMGFYGWLREQKALKAILCGHTHVEEQDRFSETAQMYVAGGNYEGCGYEVTFV